jgi:hypothetical protein
MGVFDDQKFEKLDWMTQITETIESKLNDVLAHLPDELVIDEKLLQSFIGDSYSLSFDLQGVIRRLMKDNGDARNLSWDDTSKITRCFRLEADPEVEWNAQTGQLSGGVIRLVKLVQTFEDEDLQKCMGRRGLEALRSFRWADAPVGRMNEILDLLGGCEDIMKNRSSRKKMYKIQQRLQQIFLSNEWRIRDTELADKVGLWICEYIRHGSLSALTNFCKLKVMTHNNMPIYSVKEET